MSTGEKHLHGDRPAYLSACTRLTRFRPPAQLTPTMNNELKNVERVIGLDAHPDTFTAAIVSGSSPAAAIVQALHNKLPMSQLKTWAQKNTNAQDLFVLEASGNSFHILRTLAAMGRPALVLE